MDIQAFDLTQTTTQLARVAEKLGLETVSRAILYEHQRRLQAQRLRVLVVGEVNHGKSTLINALLGSSVLPVGITPTTKALIHVQHGTEKSFLVTDQHSQQSVSAEQFKQFVTGKRSASGQLEVRAPSELLTEQIEFMDTPGINDVEQFRSLASRSELLSSDVLIFVLDATQALNRTELLFLRDAMTTLGGMSQAGMHLLIVLNRIDVVDEKERPAIVEHIERELSPYLGRAYELFQIAAKSSLARGVDESFAGQEFQRLKLRIHELAQKRAQILPLRMRSFLARNAQLLSYHVAIQARALTLEEDVLKNELSAVQEAMGQATLDLEKSRTLMANTKTKLVEESGERIRQFRKQLEDQTFAQLDRSDLRLITNILPAAVHDSVLQFSYLEAERIHRELEQLTQQILRTASFRGQRKLHHATLYLGARGPTIQLQLPSVRTEISMLAVGITGTAIMYFGNVIAGMIVTITAPLATMILRERSIRTLRETAKKHVPQELAAGLQQLEQVFNGVVTKYLQELEEHMLLANQQLMHQVQAILQRAQQHFDISGNDGEWAPELAKTVILRERNKALSALRELDRELAEICTMLSATTAS